MSEELTIEHVKAIADGLRKLDDRQLVETHERLHQSHAEGFNVFLQHLLVRIEQEKRSIFHHFRDDLDVVAIKKDDMTSECVSNKIPKLLAGGYPENQAAAIAFSMCRRDPHADRKN